MKLVQRLLYYTRVDLWLPEDDKDWHCPLLVTPREKVTKNWRTGAPDKLEERREKIKGQDPGQSRDLPSIYTSASQPTGSGGSWSSRGSWHAAASAWAASSWRGAEGAATVTREHALVVVAEVHSWTGSCRP